MTTGCYILQNKMTGKRYVGQSSRIENRLKDHAIASSNNVIHKAIRSYGFSTFGVKIWECEKEYLDELEEFLISELDSVIPNGYNVSTGGYSLRGIPRTEAHCKKISEAHKGKVIRPETREKLRLANLGKTAPNKGMKQKPLTEEQKEKKRNAHLAYWEKRKNTKKIRMTKEEVAKKLSEKFSGEGHPMYGKPKSEETRQKISESLMGNIPWNKGKPMSESARLKMIATKKAKHLAKKEDQSC